MLDSLQLSPHDLALTSMTDVDPTTLPPEHYKDQFANTMTYEEAWNYSCLFQREKWREAIHKEFGKVNDQRFGNHSKSLQFLQAEGWSNANGCLT